MTDSLSILVVDDERNFCRVLSLEITRMGHQVASVYSGEKALERLAGRAFDVAIIDVTMPGIGGMETLRRIRIGHPETDVLMLTGDGSIEGAVEAMKRGAFDYLTKPARLEEIEMKLDRIATERTLRYNVEMIGDSPPMQQTRALIDRVASTESSVLLVGESGSGKELAARRIHAGSTRRERSFVPVNCANLQESLLESDLFGYVKGAFTGAMEDSDGLLCTADGGTLFLDEIGEMSLSSQAKLLRFLESGEVRKVGAREISHADVRLICATHRDLEKNVADGTFREDLFHRINIFMIRVPPLRECREDISTLLLHFLQVIQVHGREVRDIAPDLLEPMLAYRWPGNVRELRNVVERMMIFSTGPTLGLAEWRAAMPTAASEETTAEGTLARAERAEILEALHVSVGNKTRAAKILGISVRTLYNKLRAYEILSAPDST